MPKNYYNCEIFAEQNAPKVCRIVINQKKFRAMDVIIAEALKRLILILKLKFPEFDDEMLADIAIQPIMDNLENEYHLKY